MIISRVLALLSDSFMLKRSRLMLLWLMSICATTSAQENQPKIATLKNSIVLITMFDDSGSKATARSYGSGTIIDADGSILTNYHVLANESENSLYDFFVVSLKTNVDAPPEPFCIGSPQNGKLDPMEDLAVVKCDKTLGKRNYTPKDWPAIQATAAQKANIKPGTQIWVLGYSVKKHTAHLKVQAGLTSGWSENSTHQDAPPFIRTDANISHGMSGGAAIDSEGHFVGVPTAFRNTLSSKYAMFVKGKIGLIRTLESVGDFSQSLPKKHSVVIKAIDSKTKRPIGNATVISRPTLFGPRNLGLQNKSQNKRESLRIGATTKSNGLLKWFPSEGYDVFLSAPGYLPQRLPPPSKLKNDEEDSLNTTKQFLVNMIHY